MIDPQDPNRGIRGLNPLGKVSFALALFLIVALILDWEPMRLLGSGEPSVWRYGLEAVLLMVNVPLAWTAWKAKRDSKHRWLERLNVAIPFVLIAMYMIGSGLALQDGSHWRPRASLMLVFTLAFFTHAFGVKRHPAPPSSSALGSSDESAAARG